MAHLILPPSLKRFIAKDAFSDLRYAYSVSRGIPKAEPALQTIAESVRPTDVVVEVGASTGGGTVLLSSRAKHVFAFEPNRHSYRILRHFTRNRPNVTAFNLAVGAGEGVARLNIVDGEASAQGSSIRGIDGLSYRGRMAARMVSLDSVEFPLAPSVLIVDCEGYESEVLAGAKNVLGKVRTVFVETHAIDKGHSTLSDVLSQIEAVPMMARVFLSGDRLPWISGIRLEASGNLEAGKQQPLQNVHG